MSCARDAMVEFCALLLNLVVAFSMEFSSDSDVQRLNLLEITRPTPLLGLPAYILWLDTSEVSSVFGIATIDWLAEPGLMGRMMANKPCAGLQDFELFAAEFAKFAPVGAFPREWDEPRSCE